MALALVCAAGGCSSYDEAGSSSRSQQPGIGNPFRPWVEGGQTGALIPECGLTAAARAGDSIPGGDTGIVIQTDSCVGLAVAELQLFDENGMMVEFSVETLPGGAVLLRPLMPLAAGIYTLELDGKKMQSVVAEAPVVLPSELGRLTRVGDTCGATFSLALDAAVLEYLPQLKLSVAVDGGVEQTWFDYGALDVVGGSAALSLRDCFPSCLADGPHTLRVTGELAGELGTLEPIELAFDTACGRAASVNSAPAPADDDAEGSGTCRAFGGQTGTESGSRLWLSAFGLLVAALALRRARRSSA